MENLYVSSRFVQFKHGGTRNYFNTVLLKINNVANKDEAKYYLNKAVAFQVPKSQKVVYGKITKLHGNRGVVEAKFNTNLSARFLGYEVKVMLYPQ